MRKPPSSGSWGTVSAPTDCEPETDNEARRAVAIAKVEARAASGEISGQQADEELLEIALGRFDYLPPEAIAELRAFGRELNESLEMVETRLGPRPHETPSPSPWRAPSEGGDG